MASLSCSWLSIAMASMGAMLSTFVYCVGPHIETNFMPGPTMTLPYAIWIAVVSVYALTHVCAFYGAVGFACMELTNLFFIPHLLGWQHAVAALFVGYPVWL